MIVDTSVVVGILGKEPGWERHNTMIATARRPRMSVVNALEATMVTESRGGAAAGAECDRYVERMGIELEPVTLEQLASARYAWRRFGKGNHPAGLNFGDCFAYALADVTREPLLFKGDDFARTDVRTA